MNHNLILATDSYKASHWLQYPPGTEFVHSYIEARWKDETEIPFASEIRGTVFFGLQAFLYELDFLTALLVNPEHLTKVNINVIQEAEDLFRAHGEPFNREGWEYIRNLGYLPIRIRAVQEGMRIPLKNVLLTIENTDPKCFWLTSYLETSLLRAVWYPTTVATISRFCKDIIIKFLTKTCDDPAGQISFKLHDFGARGVSSSESAALGGLAHLINFRGTDTVEALIAGRQYYNEPMAGFSIPAAEHSTITTWGGPEFEVESFRNMLKQFGGPGKLVAVVSDSYDIQKACEMWGTVLKDEVLNMGGTLVIRPDSGDPIQTTLKVVSLLDKYFGSTVNRKGYKVLHPSVRIIQGDGVNPGSIFSILNTFEAFGYSAENIAFGMGGALLQKVNRDTFGWAMKASAICVNGQWRDVYKQPVGQAAKNSKRGRLELVRNIETGEYQTLPGLPHHLPGWAPMLETVYENGKFLRTMNFSQVRENSERE